MICARQTWFVSSYFFHLQFIFWTGRPSFDRPLGLTDSVGLTNNCAPNFFTLYDIFGILWINVFTGYRLSASHWWHFLFPTESDQTCGWNTTCFLFIYSFSVFMSLSTLVFLVHFCTRWTYYSRVKRVIFSVKLSFAQSWECPYYDHNRNVLIWGLWQTNFFTDWFDPFHFF